VFVDVGGHDPELVDANGQKLIFETDSGPGYRFGLRRDRRQRWGVGIDFFWFTGAQDSPLRTDSGDDANSVSWLIADGGFTSSSPGDVLFLERLSDTDLNAWTVDLFAIRTLSSGEKGAIRLLFGLRNADFDNDIRAVVGVENVGGTRIDASSNYGRMIGPLIGVGLDRAHGRHLFELQLTQSVVFGDAELSVAHSDFSGAFTGEEQEFIAVRQFSREESVTIPMTELQARWTYALSPRVEVGLGALVSLWVDVSTPPGVEPRGSLDSTYKSTIAFSGLFASVGLDF
jgi:hypothetical protein